jgi:hypothetical protein
MDLDAAGELGRRRLSESDLVADRAKTFELGSLAGAGLDVRCGLLEAFQVRLGGPVLHFVGNSYLLRGPSHGKVTTAPAVAQAPAKETLARW